MSSISFGIGDIRARFLDPESRSKETKLLEKRLEGYKTKAKEKHIGYDNGDFLPKTDFITYAIQLPGKLDEISVYDALFALANVALGVEKLTDDNLEAFELHHIVAKNALALADKLAKESDKSGDTVQRQDAINSYRSADSYFDLAMLSSEAFAKTLPGARASILAEHIAANRRRLRSVDNFNPKLQQLNISNLLHQYKILFEDHTFPSIEEAASSIAGYLDTLSYTVNGTEDLKKYSKLASALDKRFPDMQAAKDTLEFYDSAVGK